MADIVNLFKQYEYLGFCRLRVDFNFIDVVERGVTFFGPYSRYMYCVYCGLGLYVIVSIITNYLLDNCRQLCDVHSMNVFCRRISSILALLFTSI